MISILSLDKFIYIAQIVALLICAYMVFRARHAINGLARGVFLLLLLLIVRRVNDAFGILDETGVLILSSGVVVILMFDIWQVYKDRTIYAEYLRNRQKRIDELERSMQGVDTSEYQKADL